MTNVWRCCSHFSRVLQLTLFNLQVNLFLMMLGAETFPRTLGLITSETPGGTMVWWEHQELRVQIPLGSCVSKLGNSLRLPEPLGLSESGSYTT